MVEKEDPTGQNRRQEQDKGKPLAGKSTLNRLELHPGGESQDRYKKIGVDEAAVERFLVKVFLDRYETPPARITVDLDATDDPLHGHQEGRFFHGFYNCYCYLPLYMFCGGFPLCAQLRVSNIDASEGTVEVLERMVGQIRERWPQVEILIRGDSGFAREKIMAWCEANGVDYLLGLAKNKRLLREIEKEQERARAGFERRGQPTRIFAEFSYRTRKSWSRSRRVVAKAEHLAKGANPRFIVTSLSREQIKARPLYERVYCARGDMENRIKEQQLDLFADRTSSSKMRANQLRLWFSTVAYLLLHLFRELGLKGTEMAKAQCGTIRLKLLKIGAQVKVSVRRILVAFAVGYPYQRIFAQVYENLLRVSPVLRRAGSSQLTKRSRANQKIFTGRGRSSCASKRPRAVCKPVKTAIAARTAAIGTRITHKDPKIVRISVKLTCSWSITPAGSEGTNKSASATKMNYKAWVRRSSLSPRESLAVVTGTFSANGLTKP